MLIDRTNVLISIARQAELLGLSRSAIYYEPVVDTYDIELMRLIDEQYTKPPFYGSRRMTVILRGIGHVLNRKRIQRLMRVMGIEAIYQKPRLSKSNPGHRIYPYLLRDLEINRNNHVWGTDITYIRLAKGWVYLVAIMDWFSRYVLSWELSTSLEVDFCTSALELALTIGMAEILNSDQGSQFTSTEFVSKLEQNGIRISMDGKGRAMDNIFTERLWRSLKYEEYTGPSEKVFDFKFILYSMIATKEIMNKNKIAEGDNVFFTGLFTSNKGQKRNQPIIRFGKVALISDEKVEWTEDPDKPAKFMDLYLLESLSFGGNSGSPVFFHLSPLRTPGQISITGPNIFLAGIMRGYYYLGAISTLPNKAIKEAVMSIMRGYYLCTISTKIRTTTSVPGKPHRLGGIQE